MTFLEFLKLQNLIKNGHVQKCKINVSGMKQLYHVIIDRTLKRYTPLLGV